MKVLRLGAFARLENTAVALGVFDGMHLAHRRIIKAAVTQARRTAGKCVVVTFWPHPQKKQSLYSLAHRLRLLEELGVDICVTLRFTRSLSRMSARDFVRDILVKKLGAQSIYVGRNFRFGHAARGDAALLVRQSARYGFRVKVFEVIKIGGLAVSSTIIRRFIFEGKLSSASRLLGRPVSVLGTVVKGSGLGRRLGFPTANIDPHHEVLPPQGVYAVRVALLQGAFAGACYIGPKPDFSGGLLQRRTVEIHLLGFCGNLYGRDIEVQFLKKIREVMRFASTQELVVQLQKDTSRVRSLLSRH